MRTLLTGLATLVLASTSALATTTAPAPGGTAGTTPGAPAAGSIGDYWWLIVLAILIAVAAWYFSRSRNRV